MSGNLCRCGAYPGIERAVLRAAEELAQADGQAAEDDGRDGGPLRGALGARRGRAAGLGGRARAERRRARASRGSPARGASRGAARYVSDIALPGMLHGVVVRSPHAHATVELDVAAARAVPGVHAVLSPADENVKQGRKPIFAARAGLRGRAGGRARVRGRRGGARGRRRRWRRATRSSASSSIPRRRCAEQRLQEDPVEDESGDVEAGMSEADVIVEGEYAHVGAGAPRARAALRGRAVARRRAARVRLDAGHLRRARRSSRAPSTSTPTACT